MFPRIFINNYWFFLQNIMFLLIFILSYLLAIPNLPASNVVSFYVPQLTQSHGQGLGFAPAVMQPYATYFVPV